MEPDARHCGAPMPDEVLTVEEIAARAERVGEHHGEG